MVEVLGVAVIDACGKDGVALDLSALPPMSNGQTMTITWRADGTATIEVDD